MKAHTQIFKDNIKTLGRELDSKITYTIGGTTTELGNEQLNSVTPHYEADILKSVMKQLDIDSNVEIPIGTEVNYQFGLKVGNSYEYLDYGNYIIYSSEKQEDTRSWKIVAYDKMLYAMKDYEQLPITYPITIKDYLTAICTKIGLTLKQDSFVNEDKQITSELYLSINEDEDGNISYSSLNYTYRDVLDEIAGATASTICINEDDEIEVRYVKNTGTYTTQEGTNISIENVDDSEDLEITLKGNTIQNGTPTPDSPQPINVVSGRQVVSVMGKNLVKIFEGTNSYTSGVTTYTTTGSINKLIVSNNLQSGDANTGYNINIATGTTQRWAYIPANILSQPSQSIVTESGTYTISLIVDGGTFSGTSTGSVRVTVGIVDTSTNTARVEEIIVGGLTGDINVDRNLTFTIGTNEYIKCIGFYTQNIIFNNQEIKIQLEKGSTATSYEPYKGNTYEINLGKNLFDDSTLNNKWISQNGTITTVAGSNSIKLNCKAGETYSLSTTYEDTSTGYEITAMAFYNSSGTLLNRQVRGSTTYQTITATAPTDTAYMYVGHYVTKPLKIQLEKGQITSYSPYKTPIELCKIGNYQDRIYKTSGKNLFDYQYSNLKNINRCTTSQETNGFKLTSTGVSGFGFASLEIDNSLLGKQITISMNSSGKNPSGRLFYHNASGTLTSNVGAFWTTNNAYTTTLPDTLPSNATGIALVLYISQTNNTSGEYAIFTNIQIELGNQATPYEPYGSGKWYLTKYVGKEILDESKYFTGSTTGTNAYYIETNITTLNNNAQALTMSNMFMPLSFNNRVNGKDATYSQNGKAVIRTANNTSIDWSTIQNRKDWLNANKPILYYVLATPTTTEITDTELISQLESIRLLEGLNNVIISSANLPTILKLKYLSERDTINEEYLKDINVNFGEKYGPVNSVVFSRSAESDNIYQRDEESVQQNGLTEVKIIDNQILNSNNRDDFLEGVFNQLNGFSYYANDFVSTGITYYDLCDRYNVKVDNNKYSCVMLNDELDITQGLVENIHTDIPEKSETDYKKADSTDRRINQAYIIVDKQNQEINSVVRQFETLTTDLYGDGTEQNQGQLYELGSKITQKADSLLFETYKAKVDSIETDGVNLVNTTMVRIDNSGLSVSTDNSKISTSMTNEAFTINSSDKTLAFFGYDNDLGATRAEMDNLTITNYLTAGNHRIEKFERDGENRTGYFYIGG